MSSTKQGAALRRGRDNPPLPARPNRSTFRNLGSHARQLLNKSCAKRGFSQSDLLSRWQELVGENLAGMFQPVRLRNFRRSSKNGTPSATLVVQVPGALATEAAHMRPILIERLNAFYGYRAIANIQISQAHSSMIKKNIKPNIFPDKLDAEDEQELRSKVQHIATHELQQALSRLGRTLKIRNRSASQINRY